MTFFKSSTFSAKQFRLLLTEHNTGVHLLCACIDLLCRPNNNWNQKAVHQTTAHHT